MKTIITLIIVLCFGLNTSAQTPCTLILKNRSVIEAYHLGNINQCKKKRKGSTNKLYNIQIEGLNDNTVFTISDFSDIKEIKFDNYQSKTSDSGKYCVDATIIYKNGNEIKLKKACIKCSSEENSMKTTLLPIHIKNSNMQLSKREIDLRSIETLIF